MCIVVIDAAEREHGYARTSSGRSQAFEADESVTAAVPELNFVAGILPGFVGFLAFSEGGVLDPVTREPTSRPVGQRSKGPWLVVCSAGVLCHLPNAAVSYP